MREIAVFSGSAHPELAAEVCAHLGVPLSPTRVSRFANDCLEVQLQANCRERDVFLIQPLVRPVQEHLVELLLMCDAVRSVHLADPLKEYMVDLAEASRTHQGLMLGLSPRATLQLAPLPAARRFEAVSFPSVPDGIAAVSSCIARGLRPSVVRMYDEAATRTSLGPVVEQDLDLSESGSATFRTKLRLSFKYDDEV